MPGLREWGSGLETLTECYFKYVERYVVEAGRTFQRPRKIHHPTVSESSYPYDIDLIAANPAKRKVMLISCSEKWGKTLEETEREFKHYEIFVRNSEGLGFGDSITIGRRIACVGISEAKKRRFSEKGIEILEADFMVEKLLKLLRKQKVKKRKGVHREPLLWLLQTLDNMGKIRD